MDIDTGNHYPIAKKLYTLPLPHTQYACKEVKILEKSEILSLSVCPCSICYCIKESSTGWTT